MEFEKNYFDQAAATWDENPQSRQRAEFLAGELSKTPALHSGMTVLDFGAGTGITSFLIHSQVQHVITADTSGGMIDKIKEKIALTNCPNITPMLLKSTRDLKTLKDLDLIFANMSLHHVEQLSEALQVFHTILKPGGMLAVLDLHSEDGSFHSHVKDFSGHHGFETDKLTGLLKTAGFKSITYIDAPRIIREKDGKSKPYGVFLARALRA